MGAHRLDRTGWGRASLAAFLAACSGGGDAHDPGPTAALSSPSSPVGTARREVAPVDAEVEVLPEGVKPAGRPPQCVQYEMTGGKRGTVHQIAVVLENAGGPAFAGPAGTKVFYRVKVEAGGQAFDGYASFAKPRQAEGFWVYDPDDLTLHGTETFQPEGYVGIQEVAAGLTRCTIFVRRPDQEASFVPGTRLTRHGDDPVVQDVEGNTHPINEA